MQQERSGSNKSKSWLRVKCLPLNTRVLEVASLQLDTHDVCMPQNMHAQPPQAIKAIGPAVNTASNFVKGSPAVFGHDCMGVAQWLCTACDLTGCLRRHHHHHQGSQCSRAQL